LIASAAIAVQALRAIKPNDAPTGATAEIKRRSIAAPLYVMSTISRMDRLTGRKESQCQACFRRFRA
jgi:hypothetical protein